MDRKDLIAQNIKALREANNLSQKELASMLHVTRQAVTRWENGQTEPDLDTIIHIADIFGVSVEYLITSQETIKEVLVEKEVPVEKIVEKPVVKKIIKEDRYWKDVYDTAFFWMTANIMFIIGCFIASIVYAVKEYEEMAIVNLLLVICFSICLVVQIRTMKKAKRNKSDVEIVKKDKGEKEE